MTKHAFRNPSSASMWTECELWADFKRRELDGEIITHEQDTTAADRGTMLHQALETLLRKMLQKPDTDPEVLLRAPLVKKLEDEDRDALARAFHASLKLMRDYGWPSKSVHVGLEVPVTLGYEKGSKGTIDLLIVSDIHLVVADAKFGRGEVPATAVQLRVYSSEGLEALEKKLGRTFEHVEQAIIQPELSDEAVMHQRSRVDLVDFSSWLRVEVERQERDDHIPHGATDASVCKWCPYKSFKLKDSKKEHVCSQHQKLIEDALDDVEIIGEESPRVVSRLMRSKKAIEDALKRARLAIIENPAFFEADWIVGTRRNGRAFDLDKASESEIAHELRKRFDMKDPYRLKTATQIIKDLPPEADIEEFLTPLTHANVVRQRSK